MQGLQSSLGPLGAKAGGLVGEKILRQRVFRLPRISLFSRRDVWTLDRRSSFKDSSKPSLQRQTKKKPITTPTKRTRQGAAVASKGQMPSSYFARFTNEPSMSLSRTAMTPAACRGELPAACRRESRRVHNFHLSLQP